MKKVIALLIVALLTVSLFGCGSKKKQNNVSSITETSSIVSEEVSSMETSSVVSEEVSSVETSSVETAQSSSKAVSSKTETSKQPKQETITPPPQEPTPQTQQPITPTVEYFQLDLVNKLKDTAKRELENNGFTVSIVEEFNTSVEKDKVIRTSPKKGDVLKDKKVTLYVSKGIDYNNNYVELPQVPLTITGSAYNTNTQRTDPVNYTITKLQFDDRYLNIYIRNNNPITHGSVWINYKIYDKDGIVKRTSSVSVSNLAHNEITHQTIFLDYFSQGDKLVFTGV